MYCVAILLVVVPFYILKCICYHSTCLDLPGILMIVSQVYPVKDLWMELLKLSVD